VPGEGTASADAGRAARLLEVEHLRVEFPAGGRRKVHAVSDVSFTLDRGETLGLVGESGCGKSSTGRAIMLLPPPTSGRVRYAGEELTGLPERRLRSRRQRMQLIFQDPISSLNPRLPLWKIVAEPLLIAGGGGAREAAGELLERVGIDPSWSDRRPHQLSGGQCQRVSIARALACRPGLLICDEPVSALDVSVQAQVLNLLQDLKDAAGLSMLFISHDLSVVKNVSDRVAVMYLGRLCEVAPAQALYDRPAHPYTAALLAAVPEPDPTARRLEATLGGEPPSPLDPPSGCRFRTRCPRAEARCATEEPTMRQVAPGQSVACHFPLVPVGAQLVQEGL
jgi:peptide/nickel transport system ATP-binding protein